MISPFDLSKIQVAKYLFFTGKGGVGKTSVACASALAFADGGRKVLLVSTDPASNLQDVFETAIDGRGATVAPGLTVVNVDPVAAAAAYRESVVGPYRGKLPDAVITNMEEQLSGACTVEIAAFNEFTSFLADKRTAEQYDHILFDTAPTGHTLRMLQLPSAWSNFISESTHGASCLGQLSGLESKKKIYKEAVATLADSRLTTLFLVSLPEGSALFEAERASKELKALGIENQALIINGIVQETEGSDETQKAYVEKQRGALEKMPSGIADMTAYSIPLRSYTVTGIRNVRRFFSEDQIEPTKTESIGKPLFKIADIVDDIIQNGNRIIFTMGKGGVGKTTVAAAIALGLMQKGKKVHLATTDPAAHLDYTLGHMQGISISDIDEEKELAKYREEVLSKAAQTMSGDDLAYIEEDLRSPCTQEIAVFRAFAEIAARAEHEIVVIDTAPTGHTLLLLDATQSYHREVKRTQGEVSEDVKNLLPRLRNEAETQVIIVTLPEATPVYEASRLSDDLRRAGIHSKWWVVNKALSLTHTKSLFLRAKASSEAVWIDKVAQISQGSMAVIPWEPFEIRGKKLLELLK